MEWRVSVLDIQDYFEYILKKNMKKGLIIIQLRIYINKVENRITFIIKTEYCLELCLKQWNYLEVLKVR